MTKNDILLLSEIYDKTRIEKSNIPDDQKIPQKTLDYVTDMVDTLLHAFVEKPMMEKHIVEHYGPGYEKDFSKLKEHINEFSHIWENILYEINESHS